MKKKDYNKTIGIFNESSSDTPKSKTNHKKKRFGIEEEKKEKTVKKERTKESITEENMASSTAKELTEKDIIAMKKAMKEERKFKPIWFLKSLIVSVIIVITLEVLCRLTTGHGANKAGTTIVFIDSYISLLGANFLGDKMKWNKFIRIVIATLIFIIITIITELLSRKFNWYM